MSMPLNPWLIQISRCCLRASHTPSTTWAAPRILIRSGSSTNHIAILRVLLGPTTHSRECSLGARNSMSPSPTVIIAKASMSLLFHTALFSFLFLCCTKKLADTSFYDQYSQSVRKRQTASATVVSGTRIGARSGVKVLIIGATGATGQILMREALAQDHEVTALARNPSALAPEDHRLRVLQGNALDVSSVEAAVAGQDAVLSALGTRSARPTTLFSESTHNVISAMNKHGVRRLVCITGVGVGDSKGHVGFLYDRIMLPFVVKNIYEDKTRQEEAIKQSDLDWVIVRPARLTDESTKGEYNVFLGGSYTAKTISRADVAAFMLAQLTDDTYVHKMPVVSY